MDALGVTGAKTQTGRLRLEHRHGWLDAVMAGGDQRTSKILGPLVKHLCFNFNPVWMSFHSELNSIGSISIHPFGFRGSSF